MEQITLQITGMSCGHCVDAVEGQGYDVVSAA